MRMHYNILLNLNMDFIKIVSTTTGMELTFTELVETYTTLASIISISVPDDSPSYSLLVAEFEQAKKEIASHIKLEPLCPWTPLCKV
jgi:hypothetical protein